MLDLENDDVTGHYWRGLKSLRSAFTYGEPLARHPGVGRKIADWLLQRGLIETVGNPEYRHSAPCYRVTDLGHEVRARGQWAKPRAKKPRLQMVPPRIGAPESRLKPPKGE